MSLIINYPIIILLNILSLYFLIYKSRLVIILTEYWINRIKFHYYIYKLSKLLIPILSYWLLNPLALSVRIQVREKKDLYIRIYIKELGEVSSPIRTGYLSKGNIVESEVLVTGLWIISY